MAEINLNGTDVLVLTSEETANGAVYVEAIDLNIEDPASGTLAFDNARFQVIANAHDVNILSASSPVTVVEQEVRDRALVIKLDRPYALRNIYFDSGRKAKKKMRARREPSGSSSSTSDASADITTSTGSMGVEFASAEVEHAFRESGSGFAFNTDERWAFDYGDLVIKNIALHRVDGDNIIDEATITVGEGQWIDDFVADQFAIRYLDSEGSPRTISDNTFDAVWVRSPPTGVKVGLMTSGAEIDTADFFWNQSGQDDEIESDHPANQNSDGAFLQALERAASNVNMPWQIVIKADTPVDVELDQCEFEYSAAFNTYLLPVDPVVGEAEEAKDKMVFEFDGLALRDESFRVRLPSSLDVDAMTMRIKQPPARSRIWPSSTPLESLLSMSKGLRLKSTDKAAQRITLEQPLKLAAYAAPIRVLSSPLVLQATLKSTWRDQPLGESMVQFSDQTLDETGRFWLRFAFDEPTIMDQGESWLEISVTEGECVWLSDPAPATEGSLYRTTSQQGLPAKVKRSCLIRLFESLDGQENSESESLLAISINTNDGDWSPAIIDSQGEAEQWEANIETDDLGEEMEIVLRASTFEKSVVTIYAPEVVT